MDAGLHVDSAATSRAILSIPRIDPGRIQMEPIATGISRTVHVLAGLNVRRVAIHHSKHVALRVSGISSVAGHKRVHRTPEEDRAASDR